MHYEEPTPCLDCVRRDDFQSALGMIESGLIGVNDLFGDPSVGLRAPLLTIAVKREKVEIVRQLVNIGADVNQGHDGGVPLVNAAGLGNSEIVGLLLEAGAEVNARMNSEAETGEPALMTGASLKGSGIVRCLLAAGADPGVLDGSGRSAMFPASLRGNPETIQLLLESGCPVTGICLHKPVIRRQEKVVNQFLKRGAEVNARFPENAYSLSKGDTPLILASERSPEEALLPRVPPEQLPNRAARLAIIDRLLKSGADVSAKARNGKSALLIAIQEKDLEIARRLVKGGADPNEELLVYGNRLSARIAAQRSRNEALIDALRRR